MKHVVILVPGIMGSVLKLGDEVIWPGSFASLVLPFKKMEELLRPDLTPADCIRTFGLSVYQALVDDLALCGFREADGTLRIAAYDWRRSIESTTPTLADHIAAAVAAFGADVEISLVAHSMGGLLSRYFLESGNFDGSSGYRNVRRLITLGTPHRGAAIALPLVLGLERKLFLSAAQAKQLASNPGYPSAYQLLPWRGEVAAWDGSGAKQQDPIAALDLFDPVLSAKLGLESANLAASLNLQRAMANRIPPAHVRYFCFSGNRQRTATYALVRRSMSAFLRVDKVEQTGGGDGTVPIWSSTLPSVQFRYVAGEHGTLFKDGEVRAILAMLLGKPGILAAGAANEISVKEPVVQPKAIVSAVVKFPGETTEFEGQIRIERLYLNDAGAVGETPLVKSLPIKYKGPAIETIEISFDAPEAHGHYQLIYYDLQTKQISAATELIVQLP